MKTTTEQKFYPTNHPIFFFEGVLTLCSVHLPFENVWLRLPAPPSGEKYPSPRGFFLKIFSAKEGASREAANLTFTQTTQSGSDPWVLIGWNFYKHPNKFDWLFNFPYPGDAEDISQLIFFGKFCLSLPGQKIVCKILLDQCEDSLDFGERIFKEILTFVLDERFPEVESLTEQQMKALFVALNRKVVFAILPTRHRKSMIFQLLLCKYKINWFKRHTKR